VGVAGIYGAEREPLPVFDPVALDQLANLLALFWGHFSDPGIVVVRIGPLPLLPRS
jgi:hypothetical protein